MKKIAVLGFSILIFAACGKPPEQAVNSPAKNTNNESLTVSSRSQNNPPIAPSNPQMPGNSAMSASKTGPKTKWKQDGEPIDTARFDADIAGAQKNLKAKPADESAKKALAESYFKRGVALTEARQYASALGDYRKALKYDPNNQEAQTWVKQIIEIYDGMNKEYPKDGEEPPPLPFNKKT